jgi:hypothetical protein
MSGGNMGSSVRARLERELETPEIVVPTSNRRVALAAGGSVSTRQTQERRNDAANPEVVAPREVTSSASCDYGNGDSFSRVRDRLAVTEAMKPETAGPKTVSQLAADASLADYHKRQAEKAAEEARAFTTGKKVNVVERQIAEAKAKVAAEAARQRKAQHDFLEAAVIREAEDLTSEETRVFWDRLVAMNRCLDAGAASIVAEDIRASRVQEER